MSTYRGRTGGHKKDGWDWLCVNKKRSGSYSTNSPESDISYDHYDRYDPNVESNPRDEPNRKRRETDSPESDATSAGKRSRSATSVTEKISNMSIDTSTTTSSKRGWNDADSRQSDPTGCFGPWTNWQDEPLEKMYAKATETKSKAKAKPKE